MKSFFTIAAVASIVTVAAESNYSSSSTSSATSHAPTASATPSAQIPSSISSGCSTFLNGLNGAPQIQSCVSPLLNALSTNGASSLSSVCAAAASSSCSDAAVRTWLMYFKGNCTAELVTSPNQDVVAMYDVLYIVKPFTAAVCSKDPDGKYCLASNSSAQGAGGVANAGQTPLTSSDGTPDAAAFGNANILWLGANGNMDAATLCTPCTKMVMTSYIQWESQMPPGNGIANSPLLSPQTSLWAGIQKTCPADFISGTLSNAGASPESANGASTSSPTKGAAFIFALVVAGVMRL